MKSTTATLCAVAVLLVQASTSAQACGHCAEDRIAAVYDYALSSRAVSTRHPLAHFAWDSKQAPSAAMRRRNLTLAQATTGVAAGSARVSTEPASLSVTFNPERTSRKALEPSLQRQLNPLKVYIVLLETPRV